MVYLSWLYKARILFKHLFFEMKYEGIIVLQPPATHSYIGEPEVGTPEWFELTQDEINQMMSQMAGIPLIIEHADDPTEIGKVEKAYMKDGNACVQISLHDSDVGEIGKQLIEGSSHRGLSLSHERKTLKPVDLSICRKGARPGTWITHKIVQVIVFLRAYTYEQTVTNATGNKTMFTYDIGTRLFTSKWSCWYVTPFVQPRDAICPGILYQTPPSPDVVY